MRYEVTTGLAPPEALEHATAYFGRGGVGTPGHCTDPIPLGIRGRGWPCGDHGETRHTNDARAGDPGVGCGGATVPGAGLPAAPLVGPLGAAETRSGPAAVRIHHPQQCVQGEDCSIARARDGDTTAPATATGGRPSAIWQGCERKRQQLCAPTLSC